MSNSTVMPLYLTREKSKKSKIQQNRSPEPNVNDHRIGRYNGSTMTLELIHHRFNEAKTQPPKSVTQELHEVIRENGNLRQEIQYYRSCTDRAQELKAGAYEIAQKMMLVSFFEVDHPGHLNDIGHQLTGELQHHVDRYSAAVYEAEEEWMLFWKVDVSQDVENMI